ncbi:sulfatase family protein [Paenarthrobacter ureafaciens]|uniref:sulfatase family protein n=1 Tax=Paenarthrobacter ureafaciens TaxID=37931 RepID=UPI001C2C40C3|nr:sulfatase [Paenarthrobacter ureafaciens]
MEKPNVLWISTHDINPDLGCYAGVWPGAESSITPNLDRLANEGARFDQAFAAAPVCAPARSAIMTGCYPTAIGTMHMRTRAVPPPEVRLLPEYFRQAGYYCTNNWYTDFQVDVPNTVYDDCSPTAHWRNRPDAAAPFFAAFQGMSTHESQLHLDDEAFAKATLNVKAEQRHRPEDAPLPPYYPDTEVFRMAWSRYLDLITEMDHWVGGILDQLDEDGLTENTIVVFWSDHGRGLPRAKRWATEAGLREPLIVRWPGKIAPGTVITDVVQTLDLAPAMLDACGLPIPGHMQGVSFLSSTGGIIRETNQYAFGGRDRMDEAEDTSRTVRDARFRYIRHFHPDRAALPHTSYPDQLATWIELRNLAKQEASQMGRGEPRTLFTDLQRTLVASSKPEEEMYDIAADPHETRNLASNPEFETTVTRMRAALRDWQEHYGDLGLMNEDALIETWRPGGKRQVTARPTITETPQGFEATCETPGASIGWTTVEPGVPGRSLAMLERLGGSPADDGRSWQLYTGPVEPHGGPLWFRAWRLGFEPSPDVQAGVHSEPPTDGSRSIR